VNGGIAIFGSGKSHGTLNEKPGPETPELCGQFSAHCNARVYENSPTLM
jgi:hypothetical protein